MKNEETTVAVIKEFTLIGFLRRVLLVAWILFSIYMFRANPFFFSITTLLALISFLSDDRMMYTMKEDCLEVTIIFPIPNFNKVKRIEFSEIESLTYYEAKFDWIGLALSLVGPFMPINKKNRFEFKFFGGKVNQFRAVASNEKNRAMLNFIKARIQSKK